MRDKGETRRVRAVLRRAAAVRRAAVVLCAAVVLSAAAAAAATPVAGQSGRGDPPSRDSSALSGEVLDADTGAPLAEATLILRPAGSARPAWSERTTLTDADGRYRFAALVPGEYELEVERIGYRGARLRVTLRGPGESRVGVGLELEPIALEPVTVHSPAPAPYDRDLSSDLAGAGQVPATELRQRRYLASDVRSLSHSELLGAVTLGESDLFRALQRLPGVSTRDEWTAELWTRGSDWDQTRVTFDGLPLFNPVHGGGILSGVNSDGVGAVYLHPGVRPARLGEGATALELRSRAASGEGEIRGFGEVSLASARVAVDQRTARGRGGWMLAARRTYLDWLTRGIGAAFDIDDARIPYRFTDITARVDHPLGGVAGLGEDATLEVSGLWEADRLVGDIPDVVHGSRVGWGNLAIRATVETRPPGLEARHTIGFTAYGVDVDSVAPEEADYSASGVDEIEHDLRYWVARGELAPAGSDGSWSLGYEVVRQSTRAEGEMPPMFLNYRTTADDSIHVRESLTMAAAWLDHRWTRGPLEVDLGLRAEAGTDVANGGAVRLAPRLLGRLRLAGPLTVTAAAGRSFQYTQMLTPIAHFRPDFPSGHLWLLAGDDVPALRADVASLGGELWLGDAWLASATGYVRRADGVVIPDPRPGVTLGRPLFVVVEERGRGLELGVRRLKGRVTGSAAYTHASAERELDDLVFPTRSDRRHVVDVTALARVGAAVRVGAAYTYATGAPYTRLTELGENEDDQAIGAVGIPNARRMPAYASLDLMIEWTKRFRRWDLGVYLQVRNALDRENTANYEKTRYECASGVVDYQGVPPLCEPGGTVPVERDEFLFGLPRLPLLGFRVRF